MGKLRAKIIVSFRAKVLLPVIAVMVVLMAVTVWVVNQRITEQFEIDAKRTLTTANAKFRESHDLRIKNLVLRFRNLPNEPRYKAALQSGDPDTIRELLLTVMAEQGLDVMWFAPNDLAAQSAEPLIMNGDPFLHVNDFIAAAKSCAELSSHGNGKSDTIRVGDKLYDIVSVPLFVGRSLTGVLTLGEEVDNETLQELAIGSEVALLAGNRVMVSTVFTPDSKEQFASLFTQLATEAGNRQSMWGVRRSTIGTHHFFCSGGRFSTLNQAHSLGYLLFSSYEQPLQALQTTKQVILLASLVGILLGSAIVWLVINKVTEPLRELRDSVEAVGRGDFSRRVEVRSPDECGDLAEAFNQMTENLKQSREQLELTVETLKTTQAQLIQSEKLSGIGEFVAGVAHELNNPLTSVMGFSELLKQADKDPQHRRFLEMIHKSAQRCQKIVQALLSFARRHQPERKVVCLNSLVESALEILNYQLRTSNIQVITQLDPELPQAMVDPHQVQQVFLNLINNARQAIEGHAPKGWIKITTLTAGPNVRLTVQDSGPGIAPENLSKLFDPFFTTKEVGKGTGLGLSLCYGIIKEHGGTIIPRSKPGEGATFIVELPITHEAGEATSAVKSRHETEIIDRREGAGKRVLVIDDEEPILQMVSEALTRRGYLVDTASDGATGLERLSRTRYDVTLCDWKMPGLNGQEVYERLRAKDPPSSDRIIFITGDVVNDRTRNFLEEQKRVCLPKPFTLAEFREAIGKMLAAS